MTLDADALRNLLCERLCEDVRVDERPDGELMLRTHFCFPDGDGYPFHLAEAPSGGLRLSDCGHTLMHISYEHDIDSFLSGTRGMLLERIIDESGIHHDSGVFSVDTSVDRLPEAIFRLGQALTRVYDLTLLSRSNVGSTFYDDLADCLSALVDEAKMQRDYQPEVPNADAYPVDYRRRNVRAICHQRSDVIVRGPVKPLLGVCGRGDRDRRCRVGGYRRDLARVWSFDNEP